MAHLEITGGATGDSLEVRLDGKTIPHLRGLSFQAKMGGANVVSFEVAVDEVDIDAEALAWIKAKMQEG